MGYFSCDAESAIATCDPYNWDRSRRCNNKINPSKNKSKTKPIKIRDFLYNDLVAATNAFSADTFLGKGSHGTVYKASLDDGKLVAAVKRTITHSHSTPADNEIEILSRVHHPRLVNLIGFCVDSPERKLLVVEYMPNGSLYTLLHSTSRPPGWSRRVRFALQVAKAVHALHSSNPPVIHRDIKSSNVLIDEKWRARLGDFGLALRGHVEDVRVKCTPPAGTLGYLDPGYLAPGDLSSKSDVFSFGILLLEIVSGRNAIDVNFSPPSIVDWAVPLIKRGDFGAICDSRIASPVDLLVIRDLAVLAARCVRSTAEKRPGMAEIVQGLKVLSKRVHAPPIWNQLRKRVGRMEKQEQIEAAAVETNAEVVMVNNKTVKAGSRRNSKVSNVSSLEYGSEAIGWLGERVVRSKSIGSFSEIKTSSGSVRRKNGGVVVKMAAAKLSKSRSTGVLQGARLVQYNNIRGGFMLEFEGERSLKKGLGTSSGSSKLFFGLNDEEEKMQEKPLVLA